MLLEAEDLTKTFGSVRALSGVSFSVGKAETLGVVGGSGSGKSTLARIALGLLKPDAGSVRSADRKKVQAVFQNPLQSLNPRMTVAEILREPFLIRGLRHVAGETRRLLQLVELPEDFSGRHPRELSGGECQRVSIARALALEPDLLVCDEPVSSLDILLQAQILNLFLKLQSEAGLSYLFITHDLKVARRLCDRMLVLKEGVVCESGPAETVFSKPAHAYTRQLMEAAFFI